MAHSLILPVLAGVFSGGAVNYFADTLPKTRRLSTPACPQCGRPYPWGVYVSLRACPSCGHRRDLRTWMVLGAMLALSLYTWLRPHQLLYPLGMLLLTYFGVVIVVDLEHRLILHPTSIVGAILAAGIGTWLHGALPTVLGGLAGLVSMLALYGLGLVFTKFRARRLRSAGLEPDGEEALGAGDVLLGGILGLVLGWPLIWFGLLLGILLGGLIGLILVLAAVVRGRYRQNALMIFMPYGPSFVLSAFFILFLPNLIVGALPK